MLQVLDAGSWLIVNSDNVVITQPHLGKLGSHRFHLPNDLAGRGLHIRQNGQLEDAFVPGPTIGEITVHESGKSPSNREAESHRRFVYSTVRCPRKWCKNSLFFIGGDPRAVVDDLDRHRVCPALDGYLDMAVTVAEGIAHQVLKHLAHAHRVAACQDLPVRHCEVNNATFVGGRHDIQGFFDELANVEDLCLQVQT
ncbi:hypothetical protein BMS3Bbin02_00388 [bacterium BMS3Bbin02]|nr:hypothetical protein BMS3Bbin02_00388 [bacterium BMS3Bbin02]